MANLRSTKYPACFLCDKKRDIIVSLLLANWTDLLSELKMKFIHFVCQLWELIVWVEQINLFTLLQGLEKSEWRDLAELLKQCASLCYLEVE